MRDRRAPAAATRRTRGDLLTPGGRRGVAPAVGGRRGPRLGAPCLLGTALLIACGVPAPEVHRVRLSLRLPRDQQCAPHDPVTGAPRAVRGVQVQALGDFAASDQLFELLAPVPGDVVLDRFPSDTRALVVSATTSGTDPWRAVGARSVTSADVEAPLLLLPLGRSCLLGDPLLTALPGEAVAPLPAGGLIVAGGREGTHRGTRRLLLLRQGEAVAESVPGGLGRRRILATATASGSLVLIAGGADHQRAPIADDTFEVFDTEAGEMLAVGGQLCGEGAPASCTGRRGHGAGLLPDGRVLLVGGYDELPETAADLLTTAVIVDPRTGASSYPPGGAVGWPARVSPQVLTLDDGLVYLVGGRSVTGAEPEPSLGTVLRFAPDTGELADMGTPFTAAPSAVAVALPGARIAWVTPEARVELLLADEARGPGGAPPRAHLVDLAGQMPPLSDLRAVALADGRLLVTGLTAPEEPAAFVVDLSAASASRADPPVGLPLALEVLADGTVAELTAPGGLVPATSLRRDVLRTAFDNPPATLGALDLDWLALDAPDRWEPSPAGLVACRASGGPVADCAQASIELPTLRFADLRVTLDVEGPADLVLTVGGGKARVRIAHRPTSVGISSCALARAAGEEVVVERHAEQLLLRGASGTTRCAVEGLTGRVGISLDLEPGSTFRGLRVVRL